MSDSDASNPLMAQMRASGIADVAIARADAMLGLLAITRRTRRHGADPEHAALDAFFAFALPRAHLSQSQIMQDLWVLHELGEKRGGFFVEFGAGNGVTMSNTHLLEKRYGWRGILSEPNPTFHRRLARERVAAIEHACVWARTGETATFLCTEKPAFSRLASIAPDDVFERQGRRTVAREITVPTVSLADLLDRHDAPRQIDYISVDTEGAERAILEAFDFGHHVSLWTVEHNFTPEREAVHAVMGRHGYVRRFPEFSRFDDWYVHGELAG